MWKRLICSVFGHKLKKFEISGWDYFLEEEIIKMKCDRCSLITMEDLMEDF